MGGAWPWRDEVDALIPDGLYGSSLCGPIKYKVTDIFDQPTDIVTFNGFDTVFLEFAPTLAHAPGAYKLKLKASLINYPWVADFVTFDVNVLYCQTTIMSDLVSIPDVETIWYNPESFLPVGQILGQYYQEPNCGYTMEFKMSQNLFGSPFPLPDEVQYDDFSKGFTYSKCPGQAYVDEFTFPLDFECDGYTIPYEKVFNIMIEAYLVEPEFFPTPVYYYNN